MPSVVTLYAAAWVGALRQRLCTDSTSWCSHRSRCTKKKNTAAWAVPGRGSGGLKDTPPDEDGNRSRWLNKLLLWKLMAQP